MEIARAAYDHKDEARFLKECEEAQVQHTTLEDNDRVRVYRIDGVADVYFFKENGHVSLILYSK